MIEVPVFATKEAEIAWVFENKEHLIHAKKAAIKHGDIAFTPVIKQDTPISKAENDIDDSGVLKRDLVINTTNIIDSHMDCHIPGLWKKSLKELNYLLLLQEHDMDFDKVIADSVNDGLTAEVREMTWKQLGQKWQGSTEALIFNANISKDRNEFMYKQYFKGYVLNHSVGMRYVKLYLCINSEESGYSTEKEHWDKYYPMVINQDVADSRGYFWAVTEAKIVEGSAVVRGSNYVTPTLPSTKDIEPSEDTQTNEPPIGTRKTVKLLLY